MKAFGGNEARDFPELLGASRKSVKQHHTALVSALGGDRKRLAGSLQRLLACLLEVTLPNVLGPLGERRKIALAIGFAWQTQREFLDDLFIRFVCFQVS